MKNIILFITLYIAISCTTECESYKTQPNSPEVCHKLAAQNNEYCCYYEGKNLDTNQNEKACWAFAKTQIDNDQYKKTIEDINKGTDSHVTKKHSDVKLDCFSSFEKLNYLLIALLILF